MTTNYSLRQSVIYIDKMTLLIVRIAQHFLRLFLNPRMNYVKLVDLLLLP